MSGKFEPESGDKDSPKDDVDNGTELMDDSDIDGTKSSISGKVATGCSYTVNTDKA